MTGGYDVLFQGDEAGCHCCLYMCQGIFQVVVVGIVRGTECRWVGKCVGAFGQRDRLGRSDEYSGRQWC